MPFVFPRPFFSVSKRFRSFLEPAETLFLRSAPSRCRVISLRGGESLAYGNTGIFCPITSAACRDDLTVKTHSLIRRLTLAFLVVMAVLVSFQKAAAQSAVKVTWLANSETDLEGYKVFMGTKPASLVLADTVTAGTESRLSGLAPATTYYFAVQAYNTSGLVSALSTAVAFTTAPVFSPEIEIRDANGEPMTSGPAGILFDPTGLGTSAAVTTLTIQNTGNADLTQLNFALSGAHPGDFEVSSSGNSTLTPNAYTLLQVTFTPTATGNRTALLSISSNDADESPFVVSLTGEGTNDIGISLPEIVIQRSDGVNLAEDATLGFGAADLGSSANSQSLTIRNTGSADLSGLTVATLGTHSQDFSVSGLPSSILAPGQSADLTITFAPRAEGARSAALQIVSNDANESPFNIALSGIGVAHPEITVSNSAGDLLIDQTAILTHGSVNLGASGMSQTLTIANTGTGPLSGIAIALDGSNAADFTVFSPTITTLAPGATTTINITFVPKAAGSRTAALHITSNDADEASFDIALSGTGVAVPEIGIENPAAANLTDGSAAVAFGTVQLGPSGATQTLTIRNHGTGNLAGLSATVDGPNASDFTVTALVSTSLAPGANMALVIAFKPSAAGLRSAFLRIASNDADESPFDISLSGTGLALPEIGLIKQDLTNMADGAALAFGSLNLGPSTSVQTITIRNSGEATLSGLAITVAGTNPADFTTSALSSTSILPGGSLSFTVTFKPLAAGTRSASLQLTNNDADENPYDLTLSGIGVGVPEITVADQDLTLLVDNAGLLSFGNAPVGVAGASRTLTIRNDGTGDLTGLLASLSGTNASDFILSSPLPSSLAPGSPDDIEHRIQALCYQLANCQT
jgi:hypothetical protein